MVWLSQTLPTIVFPSHSFLYNFETFGQTIYIQRRDLHHWHKVMSAGCRISLSPFADDILFCLLALCVYSVSSDTIIWPVWIKAWVRPRGWQGQLKTCRMGHRSKLVRNRKQSLRAWTWRGTGWVSGPERERIRERKRDGKKERKKRGKGRTLCLAGLGTHAESHLNGLAAFNGGPENERAGSSFPTQEGSDSKKGCPK